jgi:hypothetical protein
LAAEDHGIVARAHREHRDFSRGGRTLVMPSRPKMELA